MIVVRVVLRFDPSLIYWLQVFVDGMEPVKKPPTRLFEDSASEKSVRTQISLFYISCCLNLDISWNFIVSVAGPAKGS